jgi:gluconolactonase
MRTIRTARSTALIACAVFAFATPAAENLPLGRPAASIDLATPEGVAAAGGAWRYSDVRIVETEFRAPDAQGQPTGASIRTWDYAPHAGGRDFDDSSWTTIAADTLDERRGGGRLSFNWYRIRVTVPERIGDFDPAGSTIVFETSIDDYAEVWVDGELPRAPAQAGGSVVGGWNADNRLVIGRNVRPGQQIQLAVFGINGPISGVPTNFIWMRRATLDFYPGEPAPVAVTPQEVNVEVERRDPRIDALVPANAKVFKLAEGFQFTEGPVWVADGGYLLFSDPNANTIYRYQEGQGLSVFRAQSGYAGADVAEYRQPGSNGLALDAQGRLTINEHGNRRVSRLEPDGRLTVLAHRHEGRRLNSPNDLVYRSDGALYFTDPPFGLPKVYDDPRKELPYSGVFRLKDGRLTLLATDLIGPNGLAFSPDERYLYVDNWDPARKVVMRYPVQRDGTLGTGEQFFDMGAAAGEEALDGLKVDRLGNLYVSGPGGLWIIAADGTHLGTVRLPRLPANFAFGGPEGTTLYLTARDRLYRIELMVPGDRFAHREARL